MGTVYAELTLRNAEDIGCVRRGYMKPEDIRSQTVSAIVDTGAYSLMIPLELMQTLGLRQVEEKKGRIAGGEVVTGYLTNTVEINWKDRQVILQAIAIPNLPQPILGKIPLYALDLMVCPKQQELVGVHGAEMELMAM